MFACVFAFWYLNLLKAPAYFIRLRITQATAFAETWRKHRTLILSELGEQTLAGPMVLQDAHWQFHLRGSGMRKAVQQDPVALLQMQIGDVDDKVRVDL